MSDIDDLINDDEERERNENKGHSTSTVVDYMIKKDSSPAQSKVTPGQQIGTVEHFFANINVAAIHLSGTVRVGDDIGIENDGEIVKMKVYGMQIDRKEVEVAEEGDSIGIKVDRSFKPGSSVYLYG